MSKQGLDPALTVYSTYLVMDKENKNHPNQTLLTLLTKKERPR